MAAIEYLWWEEQDIVVCTTTCALRQLLFERRSSCPTPTFGSFSSSPPRHPGGAGELDPKGSGAPVTLSTVDGKRVFGDLLTGHDMKVGYSYRGGEKGIFWLPVVWRGLREISAHEAPMVLTRFCGCTFESSSMLMKTTTISGERI